MATRFQRQQTNLALVQNFIMGIYIYNIDRRTANTYSQLKAALFNQFAPKEKRQAQKN